MKQAKKNKCRDCKSDKQIKRCLVWCMLNGERRYKHVCFLCVDCRKAHKESEWKVKILPR